MEAEWCEKKITEAPQHGDLPLTNIVPKPIKRTQNTIKKSGLPFIAFAGVFSSSVFTHELGHLNQAEKEGVNRKAYLANSLSFPLYAWRTYLKLKDGFYDPYDDIISYVKNSAPSLSPKGIRKEGDKMRLFSTLPTFASPEVLKAALGVLEFTLPEGSLKEEVRRAKERFEKIDALVYPTVGVSEGKPFFGVVIRKPF